MATLTDQQKAAIVQGLARYDSPAAVREMVKEEFGIEPSPQQLSYYNPENAQGGRELGEKWRTLFIETREAFVSSVAGEAAAHKAVRVRRLSRWADRAERMGNIPLAQSLYEQIAKEMGEAYTNRRLLEHTGKDGGPITTGVVFTSPGQAATALSSESAEETPRPLTGGTDE